MSQEAGTDATYQTEQAGTPDKHLKWTIMVYLAGDNNLSANVLSVLQQLEAANIPQRARVRVLACFDVNTPRPKGARYLEIKYRRFKHPKPPRINWGLHNDLIVPETLEEELKVQIVKTPSFCDPPGSPAPPTETDVKEGLSRFLQFALRRHPAERYMLILYGHGPVVAGNTFLADDNPPSFLRLRDFAEVLKEHFDVRDDEKQRGSGDEADVEGESALKGKPPRKRKPALDILAFNNCVMNGIETAYQIRGQVRYTLGSQGLALAVGWPFRKIIVAVVRHRDDPTARVAERLLRVCARSLIDFTLMDRSSEQSLCDLTTLHSRSNLVRAVRGLSKAMQDGLRVKPPKTETRDGETTGGDNEEEAHKHREVGEVLYPPVRDAIRQARLEAQSYWDERFVDLYDFCSLLLERCNDYLYQFYIYGVELQLNESKALGAENLNMHQFREGLNRLSVVRIFTEISERCRAVLRHIKPKKFVLRSYYIGPELQYSNGVSVYFPWTLPERPVIFEPVDEHGHCASAGRYNISWAGLNKLHDIPRRYFVKSAFEEYQSYEFAREDGGDWANFLTSFFKATLRNVRRFDYRYVRPEKVQQDRDDAEFFFFMPRPRGERLAIPPERVDLQKSDSDSGREEDCTCPEIKNYPRRFYVSPADCARLCPEPHEVRARDLAGDAVADGASDNGEQPCASYLGWNIRGLVAQVLEVRGDTSGTQDFVVASEPEPDDDEPDFDEEEADETESEEPDDEPDDEEPDDDDAERKA
jgi:hypothetical protein